MENDDFFQQQVWRLNQDQNNKRRTGSSVNIQNNNKNYEVPPNTANTNNNKR